MPLSRASWTSRAPSMNHRSTRTACLKAPSARVPLRVPSRSRCSCSSFATGSALPRRALSTAVQVTLVNAWSLWCLGTGSSQTCFLPGTSFVPGAGSPCHRPADRHAPQPSGCQEDFTSPRTVAGWILQHPESLSEGEQLWMKAVLAPCPELEALTRHVRSFAQILTE